MTDTRDAPHQDSLAKWSTISPSGSEHAFRWLNGAMIDIGVATGASAVFNRAYAINDSDQIVGEGGITQTHALLWQSGALTDLGTLGGDESHAYDINAQGQVVGWSTTITGTAHAFLWENGAMTDLGVISGLPQTHESHAFAINNAGQMAGWSEDADRQIIAFLLQNGGMTGLNENDGLPYHAYALNSGLLVVGERGFDPPGLHAFSWQNATVSDLGTLGGSSSVAYGVNDAGQIVGTSTTPADQTHAFLITSAVQTGGGVSGIVTDDVGNPLAGASMQVCRVSTSACVLLSTDSRGFYVATGLPGGAYMVTVFPPVPSILLPSTIGPLTISAGAILAGQDIQLPAIPVFPPGTSIAPARGVDATGIPIIYWQDTLSLVTQSCAGAAANYQVLQNGTAIRSGAMTEGPAGRYAATIAPFLPTSGYATVDIVIHCPGGDQIRTFVMYIDPSGTVRTLIGAPIDGATVTLLRSDTANGSFSAVASGAALMSPANRANPDTTDARGHFGWDVIAGYYKVRAQKAGCVAPSNPAQPYAESAVLTIPPPVTDLDLRLDCAKHSYLPLTRRAYAQTGRRACQKGLRTTSPAHLFVEVSAQCQQWNDEPDTPTTDTNDPKDRKEDCGC